MADVPSGSIGRIPFREQIAFFRRKVALPSESWTQLYTSGHDHAFVVAGATREALVRDIQIAVERAIADGKSLDWFQREFDRIVAAHGWDYNGSRNWRSRVIYETNLFTSFAAGRRQQLLEMTDTHPYWMYVHSDAVKHPRPEHLALDGLVLRWDDPFWNTFFPPNGWGCQCSIRALTERQLRAMGKVGADQAPDVPEREITIGATGPAPRTVTIPDGIDPGFEYAPGASLGDGPLARQALQAVQQAPDLRHSMWAPVLASAARSGVLRAFNAPPSPAGLHLPAGPSLSQLVVGTTQALETPLQVFRPGGIPVATSAAVVARTLVGQAEPAGLLGLLIDLLTQPAEIWQNLFRERKSGAYVLRTQLVKRYRQADGDQVMVAQVGAGFFESWRLVPIADQVELGRLRNGYLWADGS